MICTEWGWTNPNDRPCLVELWHYVARFICGELIIPTHTFVCQSMKTSHHDQHYTSHHWQQQNPGHKVKCIKTETNRQHTTAQTSSSSSAVMFRSSTWPAIQQVMDRQACHRSNSLWGTAVIAGGSPMRWFCSIHHGYWLFDYSFASKKNQQ